MPRRAARTMEKAYATIDRMIAHGASNREIAARAGVTPPTVARRRVTRNSRNIPNTGSPVDASLSVRETLPTWRDVLDGLWAAGKSRRAAYRKAFLEWANSFDDIDAPARISLRATCGCLPDDLERSPCPGHVDR